MTGAEDGTQVASLDDTQVQQMRDIMWEMNAVSSSTRTESHEVEVTEVDEDGKETTRTETVTETILEISLTHKTAEEMAQQYNFNARQNEYLALMSEPENQNLWAELLGGFNSGGGQIMNPNTDWEGTGISNGLFRKVIPLPHGLDTVRTPLLEKLPTTAEPISALRVVHRF